MPRRPASPPSRSGKNKADAPPRRAPRKERREPAARAEKHSEFRHFVRTEPDGPRPTHPARPVRTERAVPSRPLPPSPWPQAEPLFPPLDADARTALERLPEALHKVWPLNAAHRRSLPEDVAALSRLLTTERRDLRLPYWSSPAFVSAYLYYFLPWNLLRLARLLAALPLPDPRVPALEACPGLWLARPGGREAPVQCWPWTVPPGPRFGQALFMTRGACLGWKTWPVLHGAGTAGKPGPAGGPLLAGRAGARPCRPWLITAANVLNELRPGRKTSAGGRQTWDEDREDPDGSMPGTGSRPAGRARLDSGLLEAFAPLYSVVRGLFRRMSHPALLFVEPGTRLELAIPSCACAPGPGRRARGLNNLSRQAAFPGARARRLMMYCRPGACGS